MATEPAGPPTTTEPAEPPVSGEPSEAAYVVTLIGSDTTYPTLADALTHAPVGSVLRLEKDVTMEADLTIPEGITLVLPCVDEDTGYQERTSGKLSYYFNHNGTSAVSPGTGVHPSASLYRKLTVAEDCTLTVNGTLLVNSVSGRTSTAGSDQDITGGYAQIDLEGEIVVNGTLDCFGYIKGDGMVTANEGGVVGDLYIVRNWRGGSQAAAIVYESHPEYRAYPMNENDCHNIECTVKVLSGDVYEGLVKMYASGAYYYTRFPQIDRENGLYRQTDPNGYIVRTYEQPTALYKYGRERYEFHGDVTFSFSRLDIAGLDLSTGLFLYPIDGDMDFVLYEGTYTFENSYKFMPGATMVAKEGADIIISDVLYEYDRKNVLSVSVVFYDVFNDLDNVGNSEYPADRPAATLTMEQGTSLTNKSAFAGTVITASGDIFATKSASWHVDSNEARGHYKADSDPLKTVSLPFDLEIIRKNYDFEIGEDQSILWKPADVILPSLAIVSNAQGTAEVEIRITSAFATAEVTMVYATAYDVHGRMIDLVCLGEQQVGAYQTGDVIKVTLSASSDIDYLKVFVLDDDHAPMGPAA